MQCYHILSIVEQLPYLLLLSHGYKVLEASALRGSGAGVVGEVPAPGAGAGRLLLEALVRGRPVVHGPVLATVAARAAGIRIKIKQLAYRYIT